tara:strand:+ start:303 stop:449 length:147 start_codon:yes stop_codon:yes gene_type:complete
MEMFIPMSARFTLRIYLGRPVWKIVVPAMLADILRFASMLVKAIEVAC